MAEPPGRDGEKLKVKSCSDWYSISYNLIIAICYCCSQKEGTMGYTKVALQDKILEMYPEISRNGIVVSLEFDEAKNAYIVKFRRDNKELTTHLEKKDADDCMENIKCVYLGVQIGQFIKNFEIRT
jgi:hypothetical protein